MTKFEELMDIINRKKVSKSESFDVAKQDDSLEVAGSEGSKTPLLSCGDDETDPDLLSQLHMKAKTKPNDGSGSASWDATWD